MSTTYPASYSLVEDVYQTFPSIGSITSITSRNIAYQIGRVQNHVDVTLAEVYTVPFSPPPLQITTIVTNMTIWQLSRRFTVLARLADTDKFEDFKDSYDMLDDIKNGAVPLLNSSNQVIAKQSESGNSAWSSTQSLTPTFNEKPFYSQEVDEDKL